MFEKEIEEALRKQEQLNQAGLRDPRFDSIKITPIITFYEGTPEQPGKFITAGKGRLVGNALISLANLMSGNYTGAGTQMFYWMYSYATGGSGIPTVPSIRLGIGTTPTVYNTTQLATIINTPPSTLTGGVSSPSAGIYKITLTATWNPGALGTPTITEAALYAKTYSSALANFNTASYEYTDTAINLVDRICSTDGDFSSFVVNASNPLN